MWSIGIAVGALLLSVAACGSDNDKKADDDSGAYSPPDDVQIIVPFNPGGGADNSQRTFNEFASKITGSNMTIVNQPGAGGATGWAALSKKKPDGKTLAILTPPFSVIPPIVHPKNTGYKNDSFTYLCTYAVVPDTLYVKKDSGIKTMDDLIAYSKDHPGKMTIAVTGADGADAMLALMISKATGIKFTFVPFEGGSESLQGLLSGTVKVMGASVGFIDSQKDDIIPLGITTEERAEEWPDLKTFKEQGFDVVSERFRTFGGPADLPQDIVDYWSDVCQQVVDDKGFQQKMLDQGQPPKFLSSEETTTAINKMADRVESIKDLFDTIKLQ